MKITSVEFIKSVARIDQAPADGLPEIAFAGRSNVGKSSLLNALLNRKKMALVSSTPGKTRLLNYFLINNSFYFVDLPGYGYAKASKSMLVEWQKLIERYLTTSPHLRGIVALFDLRHNITNMDLDLIEWLGMQQLSTVLVGTKADKLSGNQLFKQLALNKKIVSEYGVEDILPFSAVSGIGKSDLWKEIVNLVE